MSKRMETNTRRKLLRKYQSSSSIRCEDFKFRHNASRDATLTRDGHSQTQKVRGWWCALWLSSIVGITFGIPTQGHPGPEPHPTVQELEDLSSESRAAIGELDRRLGELDRRLNERIEQLSATADDLADKVTKAEPSGGNVNDALAPLTESLKELENLVDTLLSIGGVALGAMFVGFASFAGVVWSLYKRARTLAKSALDSSRHKRETSEPSKQSAPNEENEKEEDKEDEEEQERETGDRRVVTHTKKERTARRRSPVITELHNPEESWSPRTTEDVIKDIRDRNIPYFSRGPSSGQEAEIQAKRRLGKWYLKTKSDKYSDNNLENLPDPH